MKSIYFILLAGILSLVLCVGDAECAKTYKKKTKNNVAKRIGEVIVEESDIVTVVVAYTLDSLNTKKQQLQDIISNSETELTQIEALIIKVTAEAEKAILNNEP